MGKAPSKKKRTPAAIRHNPSGLHSMSVVNMDENSLDDMLECNDVEGSPPETNQAPQILTQLVAKDAGDRTWAAATCSNMMCCTENRNLLLSNGLIDRLVTGIRIEQNLEVLLEFVGALRNLVSNDSTVVEELNKKGIVMEIESVLMKCRALLVKQNQPDLPASERDAVIVVNPLITNLFIFLNILCVASKSVIQLATAQKGRVVPFLLDIFQDSRSFPLVVIASAMTLMEVLTEDNQNIVNLIPSEFLVRTLPSYLHLNGPHTNSQIAIAAAGTIYNMRGALHRTEFQWVSEIVSYVQSFLVLESTQTLVPEIISYLNQVPIHGSDAVEVEMETDQNEIVQVPIEGTVDKQFDSLSQQALIVANVLELLANCTSNLVEPGFNYSEEWQETEDDVSMPNDNEIQGDNEDPGDDEMCVVDEEPATNGSEEVHTLSEELCTIEPVLDENNLALVVKQTQTPDQAKFAAMIPLLLSYARAQTDPHLSSSNMRELSSSLKTLRVRSLAVLNNSFFAILALPRAVIGSHPCPILNLIVSGDLASECKPEIAQSLFDTVTTIVHSANGSAEVASMALGASWCLLRSFDISSCVQWIKVPAQYISALIELYNKCEDVDVRVKIVGLFGVLGRRQPGFIDTNRIIGAFLIQLLNEPKMVAPDILVEEISGLTVLQKAVDVVRQIAKSIDRRSRRVLRDALDEALLNLRAFIKYKSQEYGH